MPSTIFPQINATFGAGDLRSVAIGDLDGEGADDLAVANAGSDDVSVLLNQCDADAPYPGDRDGSDEVNFNDLVSILFFFGSATSSCGVDGSGVVDFNDLVAALSLFGPCTPGGSARFLCCTRRRADRVE